MPKDNKLIEPIDAPFNDVTKALIITGALKIDTITSSGNNGRIAQADLYIPALRIANAYLGGFVSTTDLIAELEGVFNPTGADAEFLDGRADTRFSQKVRNLISYREGNFIGNGYAEYDHIKKGIQITLKGRRFLEEIQG